MRAVLSTLVLLLTTYTSASEIDITSSVVDGVRRTQLGKHVERKINRAIYWAGLDNRYAATTLIIADIAVNNKMTLSFGQMSVNLEEDKILVILRKRF